MTTLGLPPPPPPLASLRQMGSSAPDHLQSSDTLWLIANYLLRSIIDYSVIFLVLLNLLAQEYSSAQGGAVGGLYTKCLAVGTLS